MVQINVEENRMDNQEWTIQRNWQHWVYKTQNKKQAKNKNKTNKRQRIPKGQSRMDNPEKQATQDTQDDDNQNK